MPLITRFTSLILRFYDSKTKPDKIRNAKSRFYALTGDAEFLAALDSWENYHIGNNKEIHLNLMIVQLKKAIPKYGLVKPEVRYDFLWFGRSESAQNSYTALKQLITVLGLMVNGFILLGDEENAISMGKHLLAAFNRYSNLVKAGEIADSQEVLDDTKTDVIGLLQHIGLIPLPSKRKRLTQRRKPSCSTLENGSET